MVLYCSCIAGYRVHNIPPLVPIFSQRVECPVSILLLSSSLILCLQMSSSLQGFQPEPCVHFSRPCGCVMRSLCHYCLKSWQLLMCKAITVRCLWNIQYIRKICMISLPFFSKVNWMISNSNSVPCFLQCTDFNMSVETLYYRELVSFGSLLCSEEHGICACLWANLIHFTPSPSVSSQFNMHVTMRFIMCFYLAGLVNIAFITPSSRERNTCLVLGRIVIQISAHWRAVLTHVFVGFVSPSRQLP